MNWSRDNGLNKRSPEAARGLCPALLLHHVEGLVLLIPLLGCHRWITCTVELFWLDPWTGDDGMRLVFTVELWFLSRI